METTVFLEFLNCVIEGNLHRVQGYLKKAPSLAMMASPIGATRQDSTRFFFESISHYLYAGDTPLHMAAAACRKPIVHLLISSGADCRARNRLGAEPLHYASDRCSAVPQAQSDIIEYVVTAGADPNAVDKSGVSPLHRAVRARSFAAVKALLDAGANIEQPNGSGSTPLQLALKPTGASGSGSDESKRQRDLIIELLLERGAKGKPAG